MPLRVKSDPESTYLVLRRVENFPRVWLTLERAGPGRLTYLDLDVKCRFEPSMRWSGAKSLKELQHATPSDAKITRGGMAYEFWIYACITGASRAFQKQLQVSNEMEARGALEDRIKKLRPQRRDGPLRYLNLSDSEAREIKAIATRNSSGVTVNIGGVVTGCPCEDGTSCVAQVWVVTSRPGVSTGLLLSQIHEHWQIGPVQQWWLDYERLLARKDVTQEERDEFVDRFPRCSK